MTTAARGERSQEPVGDDVGAAVSARGRDWEEVPGRVSMAELWAQVAQRVGGETEGREEEEEEEEARNATMEAVQRAVLRTAGFEMVRYFFLFLIAHLRQRSPPVAPRTYSSFPPLLPSSVSRQATSDDKHTSRRTVLTPPPPPPPAL